MSRRRAVFSLACILLGFGLMGADVALAQPAEEAHEAEALSWT